MVGPGTGVAPFRAFLEERQAKGASGDNWLFFGDQHRATDFLYEEQLNAMLADGTLTRLDTAFSRDQAEKVYVQDRMREHSAELYDWLERGAYFYVCGDASRMAKAVEQALLDAIAEGSQGTLEQAAEYLAAMKKQRAVSAGCLLGTRYWAVRGGRVARVLQGGEPESRKHIAGAKARPICAKWMPALKCRPIQYAKWGTQMPAYPMCNVGAGSKVPAYPITAWSDAEVVGAPGVDGLLDLLLGEVFVEGAFDQAGEFVVGGEAQADDLGTVRAWLRASRSGGSSAAKRSFLPGG